jgi:hypothetical protein
MAIAIHRKKIRSRSSFEGNLASVSIGKSPFKIRKIMCGAGRLLSSTTRDQLVVNF